MAKSKVDNIMATQRTLPKTPSASANGLITIAVAPEATTLSPGPLVRTEGESDERYAERAALMDRLFAMPDTE
jgi:hypothetical protein